MEPGAPTGTGFSFWIRIDSRLQLSSGKLADLSKPLQSVPSLKVGNLGGERELRTIIGHASSVKAAVTPDGQRTVSASRDRTLRVWDLGTGVSCAPSKDIPVGLRLQR
jgi:WD40 repeat protein